MCMPSYIKLPEHNKRQYRETRALTVREDQHPLDPDKQSWKTNDFMRWYFSETMEKRWRTFAGKEVDPSKELGLNWDLVDENSPSAEKKI